MKTIEQLLFLSKNPYYKLSDEEKAVLDDFLEKKRAKATKSSPKKSEKNLERNTPVTVKNIVEKVDTYPPEVA